MQYTTLVSLVHKFFLSTENTLDICDVRFAKRLSSVCCYPIEQFILQYVEFLFGTYERQKFQKFFCF